MDAMRFLGFVAIVLAGGVMMAFLLEFLSTGHGDELEARTHSVKVEPVVYSPEALPAFFAKLGADGRPLVDPKFDDALIAFLENHVKSEQAMVSRFVHFPSVDSLYQRAQRNPPMN